MGKEIDLGRSVRKAEEKTNKLVFMNIKTTIMLILDIHDIPRCSKYVKSFSDSIIKSLSQREVRKEILELFGIRSLKKLEKQKPEETKILRKIFGTGILGDLK